MSRLANRETIVVCGATGRQGGAIARKLAAEGWNVKALTRNPNSEKAKALAAAGIQPVFGDLSDTISLENAFTGAFGVFGVTDFWEHGYLHELRMGFNLIKSAETAGVENLVFSSVGGTDRTEGLGILHFDAKREIERALKASTLNWTILRPVTFMENITSPRFRRAICRKGVLRFGFKRNQEFQLVAMNDVAVIAAKAFSGHPALTGRATEIASDTVTMSDLVAILSKAVGRTVRYSVLTTPMMHIIAAFVLMTARQGYYKVGPSLITQFRWNNNSPHGGWKADIESLRKIHPDLMTVEAWAKTINWWEGLN